MLSDESFLGKDTGGRSLDTLSGTPMEPGRFLHVAIAITTALAELHKQNIIHKSISPRTILIDPETFAVTIPGFSPSLPDEYPAQNIEVAPAYMSPEQTGRMNRPVDHRSDLYSLGVTLYEIFTGTLPFQARDIMEWVHSHIARSPRPPTEVIPEIPPTLSDIVMKLLAKNAEERYQTALGLKYDLEKCLAQWEVAKTVQRFPLGEEDISDRLLIPQKLYGRERDIDTLMGAFQRTVASGVPEMVMVAGYSGIGKTSLVKELYKPIVREHGYFISGKFDQYKRDIPYATIAEAFRELIQQILSESEERVADWKRQLQQALGINGRLIVEVIPQVELIIGPQSPVPELPPTETRNRFNMLFRQFVGVFTKKEHPLVIFLDDLQWVDSATLTLMEQIITHPDTHNLLLIGAYRDNEVGPAHPLMSALADIRKSRAVVRAITLSPLCLDDMGRIMADTFRSDTARIEPLTRLVHEKTAGNPFFAIQFLKALHDEGLLAFDGTDRLWKWDIARICDKDYTDNVVDLMAGKLRKLPGGTLQEMRLAACIGNRFDLSTLTLISGRPGRETRKSLDEAVGEGLLLCRNDSYSFLHDRIQEAAYSLVPEEQRAGLHLSIGRVLMSQLSKEAIEEHVFDVVNQLNRGAALITSRQERDRVAELNLAATMRAKASAAYTSALEYAAAGQELLGEDSWDRRHDLAFALDLHRAACEFLSGQLAAAEERLAALSYRAATTVEQAAVVCLRMDLYTTLDQSGRAVAVCLAFLRALGIDWSPHPMEAEARREYERIWSLLESRTIEDLIHLPLMEDPASLATIDVLTKVLPPALFTDVNLASLTICRAVGLSLERGNCDASCFAYVMLGRIAGPRFGDYQAGFRFGQLGYELVDRRGLRRFEASTCLCFSNFVVQWTKHVWACSDLVRRAFEAANRVGDLTYAAYTRNVLNTDLLFAGEPLPDVQLKAEQGLAFAERARFGLVIDIIAAQLALIRMLRGLTPKFGCLGEEDELPMELHLSGKPVLAIAACWYWIRKLQARYLAGDYVAAMDASSRAQPLLWTSMAFLEEAEYHFYSALSRAASCNSASEEERREHLESIAAHHRQLGVWAQNCPENFGGRAALVGAEIARIEGRSEEAMRLYEEAGRSARENRFIQNEALADELAASFYHDRGFERISRMYLREARACYARWGAEGKVKQLDEQHPWLREEEEAAAARAMGAQVSRMDAITVARASQSISGEILLSNLLDTLMRIVLENAGAQRGYLLLAHGDELSVEAQAWVEGEQIEVLQEAAPLSAVLPLSVANYVKRTRQNVILDDASEVTMFSSDAYIKMHKPVSVLCLPVLRQSNLIGLLYLENNLAKGAFTPDRIAVLEVLAAQSAISLEISMLYAALRESKRLLQAIIDNSSAVIYVKDLEGRYLLINRRFEELFHVTREVVPGKTDYDLFPKVRADAFRAFDREVVAAQTAMEAEEVAPQDDGLHTYLSIKAPLYDEAGNPHAVCGISADITERKRAEEALRESERRYRELSETLEVRVREAVGELGQKNKMLLLQSRQALMGEMLSNIAHQWRQPLNILGLLAQELQIAGNRGTLTSESREANVKKTMEVIQHMSKTIDDFRYFYRPQKQKIRFRVLEVLEKTLSLLEAPFGAYHINTETAAAGDPVLEGYPNEYSQVILNILTNAKDAFLSRNIAAPKVVITVSTEGDKSVVTITDNAGGIPEEIIDKIFDPYFTTKGPEQGTGVGLFMCKTIIEKNMGGALSARNTGAGAEFSIKV